MHLEDIAKKMLKIHRNRWPKLFKWRCKTFKFDLYSLLMFYMHILHLNWVWSEKNFFFIEWLENILLLVIGFIVFIVLLVFYGTYNNNNNEYLFTLSFWSIICRWKHTLCRQKSYFFWDISQNFIGMTIHPK